ncbi:MAG: type III pantothenate kinase [Pseudomonadota bacterium]
MMVDVGNTRIKWRMAGREGSVVHLDEGWPLRLRADWERLSPPTGIFVGSVVGAQVNATLQATAELLWPGCGVTWLQSQASLCGVRIQYAEPQRFGIDRFAALLAAHDEFAGQAMLVVDAGTAITMDVLDASGLHRGGMIMPGRRLLCASLAQGAAQLGALDAEPENFGGGFQHQTRAAMLSGVGCMMRGALLDALKQAANVLGQRPVLVLTGGDATVLLAQLEVQGQENAQWTAHARAGLVLDGLELMAERCAQLR